MLHPKHIYIFDLPTYPKGVVSLSIPALAACFDEARYNITFFDLNLVDVPDTFEGPIAFIGIKVSSQSFNYAIALSKRLKLALPNVPIMWGGELPSLLPDECLKHADVVVQSMFEPVADEFIADLENGTLKKIYTGSNAFALAHNAAPNFDVIADIDAYSSFMGLPLETSRGCTEVCTFCMVHVMQKKHYNLKTQAQLREELKVYKGKFINIIDYNFGVSAEHVIQTAQLIKESGATGYMAETCIEMLDNDNVLAALRDSGCTMIYCGLEAVDEQALKSVHKMNTNHIENYERIIRKAQSYGVQIASGFILGIDGMKADTFENSLRFFERMGIMYVKLTFITYNPGTKVAKYMAKKGHYTTDDITKYDGNHLSYLPHGVNSNVVTVGADKFIRQFYSFPSIVKRSFNTRLSAMQRLEFILFNVCYRQVYLDWLKQDILNNSANFRILLESKFIKSRVTVWAENLLNWVRRKRYANNIDG